MLATNNSLLWTFYNYPKKPMIQFSYMGKQSSLEKKYGTGFLNVSEVKRTNNLSLVMSKPQIF